MKEENKEQLDSLMDKHDQRLMKTKKWDEESKLKEAAFQKEFKQLEEKVIRPVMEDISNKLKSRGHECIIGEADPHELEVMTGKSGITMSVCAKARVEHFSSSTNYPHISFISGGSSTPKVRMRTTPGLDTNEYGFNELTSDIVEKEILTFLERVFEY